MEALGAYGNNDIITPHLDQLAKDGVLYRNSYCPLPVCTPSRYSLISGMYVHEHAGWSNHSTLNPAIETFPDVMRKAGYKTKAVGKMHFAPTYLDVGFDELVLAEQDGPGRWDDDYHRELMANNLADKIDLEDQRREYRQNAPEEYWASFGTESTELPDEYYHTNWTAKHAYESIEGWEDSGNLLMIGFLKPHHPFDPPKRWVEYYDPDTLEILPGWIDQPLEYDTSYYQGYFQNVSLSTKTLKKSMAYYYATITQIDYEVGRMVALLKEKGIYDNTIIIYTSDHGEHLGYHHQLLKGGHLYESIMKVPLIIKYPKSRGAGTESDQLVSNVDIAPTILKETDLTVPETMSGKLLTDVDFSREYVFAHSRNGGQAMARSNKYKLVLTKNGASLFFDLEKDPLELNNLFEDGDYSDLIQEHKKAIIQWQGRETLEGENYLNYDAPVIKQANVVTRDDGHRDSIISYYKAKMEEQ
jgi:arylsulfatase A-like enzyme